ncbi:hypothetical protein [Synoicihabitans lomoniglobus]|uniref:Uncharacterized protein n=1 Tax=Synoicihabitans lomoniglobus TaxID=2909285 RepID=A0AAE9ZU33_9BACT|nr:hypothetical protein [Opitutaceae bacterium LMO-M01]WED63296.1 hypothetical protein PXH66_13240 [Opitutaceae bacterium LMO-M01]
MPHLLARSGRFVSFVCGGLFTLLSTPAVGARSDYVVVSATASPGYARETAAGALRPESYVMSKGKHFGHTRDASTADSQFSQVLQALAPALAKQEYWPAVDVGSADLLIIVHWGETETYEDPMADFMAESYNAALSEYMASADAAGNADPGRLNELKNMDRMANESVLNATRTNAELLGYRRSIELEERRYFPREEERTMKFELSENRYFVALMAWDYASLRAKEAPRLRWVTRMSVRSAGNRFDEATHAMVEQASALFGTQQDGLTRVKSVIKGRKTEVKIGESVVVEETASQP